MPDGPAAMNSAEIPRRPLPAEGYDFHPLADDLGKLLTSTGRTSTWGGLDRRPGVPARDYTGAMRPPEARP
jgi:hypothetical protein